MRQTINTLRCAAVAAAMAVAANLGAQESKDSVEYGGWDKFRVGGYGEMVAKFKDYGLNRWARPDGNTKINHSTVGLPRFVLAGDYKFNSKWILGVEVEFEGGGTGIEYEMEQGSGSENGEYETEIEKGGEVALEQFHITRLIVPEFNVRVGHMVLPVGMTNPHHEPINFFGTSRPEGETVIIPSTWHETGVGFFGTLGRGRATFDYDVMVVAGANPNGFDRYNWIQKGKQGYFEEDNFTSPAYVFRLDYKGVPGLRVGGSFYYCDNVGKNGDRLLTYDQLGRLPLRIFSLDAQYVNPYVTARANWLQGSMNNAAGISRINVYYPNASPYNRTAWVAHKAVTYSAEVGLNLKPFFKSNAFPAITPFAHYEYYNPQEKADGQATMDDRCQVSMWRVGANWKALPNLVVKADYTTRQIGTRKVFGTGGYNSENEFAVGVAYVGWFFKK